MEEANDLPQHRAMAVLRHRVQVTRISHRGQTRTDPCSTDVCHRCGLRNDAESGSHDLASANPGLRRVDCASVVVSAGLEALSCLRFRSARSTAFVMMSPAREVGDLGPSQGAAATADSWPPRRSSDRSAGGDRATPQRALPRARRSCRPCPSPPARRAVPSPWATEYGRRWGNRARSA